MIVIWEKFVNVWANFKNLIGNFKSFEDNFESLKKILIWKNFAKKLMKFIKVCKSL